MCVCVCVCVCVCQCVLTQDVYTMSVASMSMQRHMTFVKRRCNFMMLYKRHVADGYDIACVPYLSPLILLHQLT